MPAPNAASLAKYGDVPVSYYTGSAEVSVPLYTIQQRGIGVPVSLNYHTGGVKVNEVASWVGTGWSLSAGGSISRVVRGVADESASGFLQIGSSINDPEMLNSVGYLKKASSSIFDTESDVYYFNLPGASGKFYFSYTGELIMNEYRDIAIESPFITGKDYWRIIAEDGTQYYFGEKNGCRDITITEDINGPSPTMVTAWHLRKILSADKRDSVVFFYENQEYLTVENKGQESLVMPVIDRYNGGAFSPSQCMRSGNVYNISQQTTTTTTQMLLSRIVFKEGSVLFKPSTAVRPDLSGGHYLSRVEVLNSKDALVKYFLFDYGVFAPGVSNRIKLNSVTEYAGRTGEALPPYKFEYNTNKNLPDKESYAQDHWGYFNGKSNTSMIPDYIYRKDGGFMYWGQGGNRDADSTFAKANILTAITYPTGGRSIFEYQGHTIAYVGRRQAYEMYDDSFVFSCFAAGVRQIEDSCSSVSQLVVTDSVMAEIKTSCACSGTGERAQASVSMEGPEDFVPIQAGCGGANAGGQRTVYVGLRKGTYRFSGSAMYTSAQSRGSASITVTFKKLRPVSSDEPTVVGGVRISRMRDVDVSGRVVRDRKFDYSHFDSETNSLVSGGVLVRSPRYHFTTKALLTVPNDPNHPEGGGVIVVCERDNAVAVSKIPLGEGTHIGYQRVKVTEQGQGKHGYSVYTYTTAQDFPDLGGDSFPFPPPDSRETRRGKMLEQMDFNAADDTVKYVRNTYTINTTDFHKAAINAKIGRLIDNNTTDEPTNYVVSYYSNYQEWSFLSQTETRNYGPNAVLREYKKYFYERPTHHAQLTAIETTSAGGDIMRTAYKYPLDYNYNKDSELADHVELVNSHIVSAVVEEQIWRRRTDTSLLLRARVTKYNKDAFKPSNVWLLETTDDLTSLNREQQTNGYFDYLLSDADKFTLRGSFSYSNGNLSESNTDGNIKSWHYDAMDRPIAFAANGTYQSVYFNGFEDGEGNSGVDDSHTGHYSRTDFSKTLTNLTNGLYRLTYWKKEGSTWHQHRALVDVSSGAYVLNIQGQIDDVRFCLRETQLTTVTYDDLLGATSEASAGDVAQFYAYDGFGRLSNIKDNDGNVVKNWVYRYYQGTSISGEAPFWNATGNKRCAMSNTGPTGNQEIEIQDLNPMSPTYLQMDWIDDGPAPGECPVCSGTDRKWINGVCEKGTQVEGNTTQTGQSCVTEYWYEFSDGTTSITQRRITSPCQL